MAESGESISDPSRSAFDALVTTNFGDIWRFVRRRTSSGSDADDLTADVFATAWRRRGDLPPPTEQRLWLYGVARRTLANHRRSDRRRGRLHLRLAGLPAEVAAAPAMRDDALWHALASLSADERDLLLMRSWDQLPVSDIALILACTPNAVSSRLRRARSHLAEALARTDGNGDGHVASDPTPHTEAASKGDRHG